jgi:hypothetical protein
MPGSSLRDRLLEQLEATQNRLDALEQEIVEAERQGDEAEKQVAVLIDELKDTV